MPRRSSASISLVLVGAAALTACGGNTTAMRRDLYKSLADCEQEWGVGTVQCEPSAAAGHGSANGMVGHYWGPYYRGARYGDSIRAGSRAVSSRVVARGGFGSLSWSRSSGT